MAKKRYPTGKLATKQRKMRAIWPLLVAYAVATIIRYVIAVSNTGHPAIVPDELLYLNIAKSIITEGRVAFAGFPVQFDNILYPLVLAPIYALPAGTNYFILVQLLNALMMNAAIFPAYYAARRVTGSESGAWITALFVLILPDCALSQIAFTESLGYPLIFAALLVTCVALDDDKRAWPPFALAGISFLMFMSKFSLALLPAGLFAALALEAALKRDWRSLATRCAGGALFLALIIAEKLIFARMLVPEEAEYVNYYTEALGGGSMQKVVDGIKGSVVSLYLFICAAGILPAVAPVAGLARMDVKERSLALGVLLALVLMLGGACYLTFRDLSEGLAVSGRVELRYTSFIIPMLVMFTLSPKLDGLKLNPVSGLLIGFTLLASVIITPFAIADTGSIDNVVIALVSLEGSTVARWCFIVLGAALAAFAGFALWKWGLTKKLKTAFLILLAVMFIAEGACFNTQIPNSAANAELVADARATSEALDGRDALLISAVPAWRAYTVACDAMSLGPIQHTSLYTLSQELGPDGSYTPFRLAPYINGTTIDRDTSAERVIFDRESYTWSELARGVATWTSANGCYLMAAPVVGRPFLRSIMRARGTSSLDHFDLIVYDSEIVAAGSVHITLRVSADAGSDGTPATITFSSANETIRLEAPTELDYVELDVAISSAEAPAVISIDCAANDGARKMNIASYETK